MDNSPKQETEAKPNMHGKQLKAERHKRWEWAEASVWTDGMLTALENGVKGGKWFSLIDKVFNPNNIDSAWQAVLKNKGAAGIDRITTERYRSQQTKYLEELSIAIKNDTYRPQAVKRVYIPKGDGKKRPLGIPAVNDRVAQAAVKQVIEPILENEFLPMSYGFRPKRGAKDALREVDFLLKEGNTWVVDADLKSYFDTIPHNKLIEKLERYIADGRVLALIKSFLKQEILEENKSWTPTEGTPQGGVLSPVLANLYLHDLDVKITQAGYKMIRYADDFVVLTKSQSEAMAALSLIQDWVEENGLILHPEKTHVGNCMKEGKGFEFLGYRFEAGTRWVRQKSILKFRETIRQKTSRLRSGSLASIIIEINKTTQGWYNYFKHVTKYSMDTFDGFIRRRLRAILCHRHKHREFGCRYKVHMKWPNTFFAKHGLFTMASTRAREVAGQSR